MLPVVNAYNLPVAVAIPSNTPKRARTLAEFSSVLEQLPTGTRAKLQKCVDNLNADHDIQLLSMEYEHNQINKKIKDELDIFEEKVKTALKTVTETQEKYKKVVQSYECTVCLENVSTLVHEEVKVTACDNGHFFCEHCLNHKVEACITNAPADGHIRCKHDGCNHVLSNTLLGKKTKETWNNACMEARIIEEISTRQPENTTERPAFVCKRPCCGKAMPINFDGCMSFDCPDCPSCFCGCCFKVFRPKGNNLAENNALFRCHEHVSTCKHNLQERNQDGIASYYAESDKQRKYTQVLWTKYFLTQKLLETNSPTEVRKILGIKPSISSMKSYCAVLGLPTGPYGYISDENEVITLD